MGKLETHYLTGTQQNILVNASSYFTDNEMQQELKTVEQNPALSTHLIKALEESEKKYALATQITSDGLWNWDLITNQIYFSARWKSMLGYKETDIGNDPEEWLSRVCLTNIEELKFNLSACQRGEIAQFEMEYALLHQDGEYRIMRCRCVASPDSTGKISRLIGSQTDITYSKKIEARLRYETCHDKLTGLPNRQLFIEQLEKLSVTAHKSSNYFSVLFIDLDRFKTVNSRFGHLIGDRFLLAIAAKLKQCLRSQDLVARLGGDEFAILLTNIVDTNIPTEIANRIQQEFSTPIQVEKYSIPIAVSIGIALSSNHRLLSNRSGATPRRTRRTSRTNKFQRQSLCKTHIVAHQDKTTETLQLVGQDAGVTGLLRDAEIAMCRAKNTGKNCHVIFEKAMHLQNLKTVELEWDLQRAIQEEQLKLYYQPIVKLASGQIIGFEALIRWQHPTKGLIYPTEFIPLAAKAKLIVPIGNWVLREACRQMSEWQQEYPDYRSLTISVNFSGQQLSQTYSSDIVAQVLQETELNPRCLKLEITESEIIENIDAAVATLEKVKSLGVQLSMDDFGTGYSSLNYLHRLPVDTLKIDRSFITGIESDRNKLELVKTIIKLAEVFDLKVIAEGIETKQQSDLLLNLRCQYGQGYLFSQPVPPEIVFQSIVISALKVI